MAGTAFASSLVAGVAYFLGIWHGHFIDLRPTSEYCSTKPLANVPTSWSWIPLSQTVNPGALPSTRAVQ